MEVTIDLEDEILKTHAKQMCSEIDAYILFDMLIQIGWHKVVLSQFSDRPKRLAAIRHWCEQNIKRPYEHNRCTFVFEHAEDATFFSLKWL